LNESPVGRSSRKTLIIIIIAIIGVTAVLTYWFLSMPSRYPWLFKGAYADYQGETVALFIPVKAKIHMEVLDFNKTHVQLFIHTKIESIITNETDKIGWVKLEDMEKGKIPLWEGDYSPSRTYEEQLYIENIGLRDCTVYEYTNNGTIRYYIDKETAWIISIRIISTGTSFNSTMTLNLNIDLTKTNIPQLKG